MKEVIDTLICRALPVSESLAHNHSVSKKIKKNKN